MAGSDKNSTDSDPRGDSTESSLPVGETASRSANRSLKDQDAEWGYAAGRSGMAIEAKMGMGIVLILVCAFGFLVYHKVNLRRQATAQLAEVEAADNGAVAETSPDDKESFDQTSITEAVAAASNQLRTATADTVPTSIRSTIDARSAEPAIQVAVQTEAQKQPAFAAFNSEPAATEPAFDMTEPAASTDNAAPVENAFAALTAQQTPNPTAEPTPRERIEATFDSPFADFDQAAKATMTPVADFPLANQPEPTTAFDSLPAAAVVVAADTDPPSNNSDFDSASPFPATDPTPTDSDNAFSTTGRTSVADSEWGPSQAAPAVFDSSEPEPVTTGLSSPSTETAAPSVDGFEPFGSSAATASESGVVTFNASSETSEVVGELDDPPFGAVSTQQRAESFDSAVELPAIADMSRPTDAPALLPAFPESSSGTSEVQTDSFDPLPIVESDSNTYRFSKDAESATVEVKNPDAPFHQDRFQSRTFTTGTSSIPPQKATARPQIPAVVGRAPQLSIPSLPRAYESDKGGVARFVASESIQQVSNTTIPCDICEVQPNDNYWTISRRAYGTARYFSALALYNQARIPDPKKLRPGMKVLIPAPDVLEQKYPELFKDQQPKVKQPAGFFLEQDGSPAYRVGEHETLSEISQKHLGRASRWIQIYRMNQNILKDPNRLKPGTVIALPNDANDVHLAP